MRVVTKMGAKLSRPIASTEPHDSSIGEKVEVHSGQESVHTLSSTLRNANQAEIDFLNKILGYDSHEHTQIEDRDFQILLSGALKMDTTEAREIVTQTLKDHEDDRNFPVELRGWMEQSLDLDSKKMLEDGVSGEFLLVACAAIMKFSSPYPDVRANASAYDNPEEYCETFRSYVVGIVWLAIGTFVHQFFTIRQPSIALSTGLLQLFSVPSGWLLAYILPDWGVTIGGTRHSLNPGPWSYKEQTFVTIMYGITAQLAYADTQVLVQKLPMFYGNEWAGAGFQITMLLSTQLLGFGIAGIFRNVLVYPSQNLFMNNFPLLALNKAFLTPDNTNPVNGWRFTRWQFFSIVFGAIFVWQWFPLYLAEFLSSFNWMTWIAPNNYNLATITGSHTGLGFNPINTFDWSNMAAIFPPLATPFFSYANIALGGFISGLIIIGIFYSNAYYTGYLPINSNKLFTNEGGRYNVSKILTNGVLDEEKYQKYSPPYFAAANLFYYGAYFAAYTCIYVTQVLYDWRTLLTSFRDLYLSLINKGKRVGDYNDTHARLMTHYKETPQWWFLVVLLAALALALGCIKGYPTGTPVWSLFMALGLSVVFLVPIVLLFSRTNNLMSINVLSELLIGYAKPGYGTAMMLVKAIGSNTGMQAAYFLSDLKLGHYAKIPPRSVFRAQIVATIIATFIVFGLLQFQMTITDVCQSSLSTTTKFTCPSENTYFSASVFWGVIGPKRVFEHEYPILKWAFLIGCFIPVPLFLVRYFFPQWRKAFLHIEPNTMLIGAHNTYAPYNFTYILSGFYVNFAFMYYVRSRFTKWFEKYNYVMAAALSAGTALSAFIIFFAVQYHSKKLEWWGNSVSSAGLDSKGKARLPLPEQGYFGPGPGNF